ncbi:helix-turn-helix transcriptional regulator [Sphaerisporangium corydalis]|uniref:Helix-turn-helix transcriptional regulator n=1 Tax=Sphaerisporangium corydalis TaxID=1441875 RepID=A0ABV9EKM5_9ACTN|nr:WYL domain-containing protein [Sphaerisporangium corydalis]
MPPTARLYAIVEELRAASPRPRSARELSARLEVSVRTVERDIAALRAAGVPVVEAHGDEGYAIAENGPPSPLSLTPAEAVAVALALSQVGEEPYAAGARSALRKLAAASTTATPASTTATPAGAAPGEEVRDEVARVIGEALRHSRVLSIVYVDRTGVSTERDVEPGVFIGGRGGFWYLVGWCRLRQDVRVFRLDRIAGASLTTEPARARRQLEEYAPDIPDLIARDSPPA